MWIDFFRGAVAAVRRLDPLLAEGRVATAPFIAAEVVSGARTRSVLDELGRHFAALPQLAEPPISGRG